jgi:YVTN family beta-propeller protein
MKKLILLATILTAYLSVAAQSGYKLVDTYHITSPGGWDYPAFDAANGKLYISHSNQVNILNATNGDSLGVITGTTGVHGIAFVHELHKGYTSNGRSNSVTVFDTRSGAVTGQVAVGKNPDWILYEDYSKKVITSNHSGGDISLIDPATDQLVSTISLDGAKLETIVGDGAGKLYVNAEDKNEIIVVDLKQTKVTAHWALDAEGPTGLAIDHIHHRLFTTCDKQLVVVDATNGKVVARVPIGDGCDGVVFDTDNKMVLTSNGEGTITVVKQVSGDEYAVVETIKSKRGARTIAIDQASHTIFLPTADYEALPVDAPKNTRPKMVSGSFQVLVYQRKS